MAAAGATYSLHLRRPLRASEAFSALAAGQRSYDGVIRTALRFDPGKPPLYQMMLHAFIAVFGNSEAVLRVPSLLFATLSVGLMLALGSEMFDASVGFAAAILWAFSPLAVSYGSWARMYSMLVAMALGQLLILWKLRGHGGARAVLACGALTAAMLYTHLGSVMFLGAESLMLLRASWRGERNGAAWTAMLLGAIAFSPFVPIAARQLNELLTGHWLDWLGATHHPGMARTATALALAALAVGVLVSGPRLEAERNEPLRWCAAICLIPVLALTTGSVAIRPMFTIRYVAPSGALLILLFARTLNCFGQRTFRLATAGIATFLLCLLPYYPWYDPWLDMARAVASGAASEPVFFESGYDASDASESNPDKGFPQGFLRVPFDRYFSGPNPQSVIDPSDPARCRQTIARAATLAHGAWLISGFAEPKARSELPESCFAIQRNQADSYYAHLFHVVPLDDCN